MKDIKQKQKFKVYCSTNIQDSVNKNLIAQAVEDNEPLILEGVASTNSVDLDGDYMTNECLEDMKTQALGLNIFLDHEHTIDKIVGKVTEVIETSSDVFKIKFSVIPSYEWYLSDFLENNINLGLSIGASVLDYENTDTGWKINKIKLHEISIVGIPANWDTFGTVQTSKELGEITAKCFNGACKQIVDNLSSQKDLEIVKDFEDGEDPDEDDIITEEEVIKLINEALIQAKDQIITEIVSEYNLDGKKNNTSEEINELEQTTDSSEDEEDKEKDEDMDKEEIVELIKEHSVTLDMVKEVVLDALKELEEVEAEVTEETPIVDKEEEVEVTKANDEEIEEDEEVETEESSEDDTEEDEEVETEKSSEVETEKSSENVDIGVTVETFDMEELKKSIKEELKAEVEAEVEEELLKALSTERKPVAHQQPTIENVEKEASENKKIEKSGNVMSAREMAKHLLN